MGSLPGKLSPFAAILSVTAFALLATPANSKSLVASSNYTGKTAVISDLRVGTHPDKTRIVLDVSQPTNLSYKVSKDGKTIRLDLPHATWQAKKSRSSHIGGAIVGVTPSSSTNGSSITLQSKTAIRIQRPFFVSPAENRGHRIVIDMVPAPQRTVQNAHSNMVASLDNSGAVPRPTIEVAQMSGAQNPYIQRAFPKNKQTQRQTPRQMPAQPVRTQQAPRQHIPQQTMPTQQHKGFLGLPNAYARGSLGMHMINEVSSVGGNNDYDAEFNPGFLMSGALGTTLDNRFRVEGEFLYTNATLKQISGTAVGTSYNTEDVSGDMSAVAFMGNAAYDFPNNSRLTPYVMGGVGLAGLFLNDLAAGADTLSDDMDWVFALQLGMGVSFALDDRTKIEVGYRYFETQDPEFGDSSGTPFESVFSSHNFLIGARIDLN